MKQKRILVAGIVLVAFCLGVLVGHRTGRPPSAPFQAPVSSRAPSGGEAAGCVAIPDAAPLAGKTGCVTGRVLKVFTSKGGNTFFDFCKDYHDCPFTSVIFSSDKSKFGDVQSLAGRQIELRGSITAYQGKPEIVIRDPEQIRVAP
jgi:hypothetical protein